jgi:hypothetical protein
VSKQLAIVGKGYQTEEPVMGNYNSGDRMKVWGKQSVFRTLSWRAYFTFVLATFCAVLLAASHLLPAADQTAEIQQDLDKSKQQEQINDVQRNQQLENLTRDEQINSTQQRFDTVKPQSPNLTRPQGQINRRQQGFDQLINDQRLQQMQNQMQLDRAGGQTDATRQQEESGDQQR